MQADQRMIVVTAQGQATGWMGPCGGETLFMQEVLKSACVRVCVCWGAGVPANGYVLTYCAATGCCSVWVCAGVWGVACRLRCVFGTHNV